jgi:hypothetical protein
MEYWTEKLSRPAVSFGALVLLGTARDAASGQYRDEESERQFGADETSRVLEELHGQQFAHWRKLGRDRQARDLKKYTETSAFTLDGLKGQLDEWVGVLMPSQSGSADRYLLAHDLAMLLEMLAPEAAAFSA